jgi:hypothetical protein
MIYLSLGLKTYLTYLFPYELLNTSLSLEEYFYLLTLIICNGKSLGSIFILGLVFFILLSFSYDSCFYLFVVKGEFDLETLLYREFMVYVLL